MKPPAIPALANPRHIRFVDRVDQIAQPGSDAVVLMTFADPALRYAVLVAPPAELSAPPALEPAARSDLTVLLLAQSDAAQPQPPTTLQDAAPSPASAARPPVFIRYRGVELTWRPGFATLLCDPENVESLVSSVVEFSFYEAELRRIEQEIAASWGELKEDRGLAFNVTPAGLERSEIIGARLDRLFDRRMRHVRIEPHLYAPAAALPPPAQKLGEELREKTRIEARIEAVDGQLEVFEHVYEMASQRIGEFRASRQSNIVELVIIVLLAAETLLMLAATLLKHGL